MLNTTHHGWVMKKIFHSRSLKTALNMIFLPSTEKDEIWILNQKIFIKKECLKHFVKSHLKYSYLNYAGFCIHTEDRSMLL